jgi:hypothetical protein
MEKPTLLASRNSFGITISVIQPLINLSYLRKYIIIIADTLKPAIGFSYTENRIRNIMFLVTMGISMKLFPHIVTYAAESDDVT